MSQECPMSKEEMFDFLSESLKIKVEDASTPTTCGGECEGNAGVKVTLLLKNPLSGEYEEIASDKCDLY
jgi:hypothetical protein